MIATPRDMHLSVALILCFSISTSIEALPELRRTFTKSFENDGSLESFFKAINYGNVRAVQEMIGNRDVNAVDDRGVAGLHIAAVKGNENMANLLIDNGADVSLRTTNGTTALHVAANNGNEKFAKTLIKSGADVNAVDIYGVSPLQLAVFENYKRMVDLLVANGANVNHIDNEGKSVLHWAAAKASDTIADTLIKSGARSVSVQDKVGKTPLYYATLTGNLAFVDVLKNFLASGSGVPLYGSVGLLLSMAIYSMIV